MYWFLALFAAYGVCFGLQNKVTSLHGLTEFTDRLLLCTYCSGFHSGWMIWLLVTATRGSWGTPVASIGEAVMFAFASAAFCYTADSAVKFLEASVAEEFEEDVDE